MKRLIVLALFLSAPLFAQTPSTPASAEDVKKMFEVIQTRKLFDSMLPAISREMPAMIEQTVERQMPQLTPDQRQVVSDFAAKSAANSLKTLPFDEMMQAMIPVYQRHFTQDDIHQIIAFYQSPVGKKFIDAMPVLSTEGMEAAMPVMQKWMDAQMKQAELDAQELEKKMRATMPARNSTDQKQKAPSPEPKK